MKKNTTCYSGIDARVMLTMFMLAIIALVIFAFNYTNREPFVPVRLHSPAGPCYINDLIVFKAQSKDISNRKLTWDFGDGARRENGIVVYHRYARPGRYKVMLMVDDHYICYRYIEMQELPAKPEWLKPIIKGPVDAVVGLPVIFKDSTPNAVQWQWWFGESKDIDATTREVAYTFREAGEKSVHLYVNGTIRGVLTVQVSPPASLVLSGLSDQPTTPSQYIVPIKVSDRPANEPLKLEAEAISVPAVENRPAKAPDLPEQKMVKMLMEIIDGKSDYTSFDKYISPRATVSYNSHSIPVDLLCERLKKDVKRSKDIRVLEVSHIVKDSNNFIISMTVNADRKGFIRRII